MSYGDDIGCLLMISQDFPAQWVPYIAGALNPVLLSAIALGTAEMKKAAEKSKKVWAGRRPCSSTQWKATGKVPRSKMARTCT
jgi:hypothetical protein